MATPTIESAQQSVQQLFLDQLRKMLPPNLSFADELAELLSISKDSAYRRIRGETVLSLDEIRLLTNRFGISLDDFLTPSKDRVSFQLKATYINGESWLQSIIDNMQVFLASQEKEKEFIYDCKDLSIFHFFQFPRLTAFKLYFWMKTFLKEEKFNTGKYDPGKVDLKLITLAQKVWDLYSRIPCTEIITHELLNVTLRQIEYAHESGLFTNKDEALVLCDECSLLANHLEQQAEHGYKQTLGSDTPGEKYDVYLNEVLIGSNTIYFKLGSKRVCFITPNNFNILMTQHQAFCQITEDHLNNMINKSVLISVSAKKERSKFFNRINETISTIKARLA